MTEPPRAFRDPDGALPLPSWEVLRVGRYYGLQALDRISRPGTVAVDPAVRGVYFFIKSGATATWPPMPADGPLGVTAELKLPPQEHCRPPGTYWLVPPQHGAISFTCPRALRAALSHVLPALFVPLSSVEEGLR
ncbi:hypothetical protein [Streptomyces niveus]|uniref:hypothetical protein n=1 Tax=Streptomyces niveus TaxID=193462 RepID=UPI0036D37133